MNNSTSFFVLDDKGICNYCHAQDELEKEFPINGNEKNIAKKIIKDGINKKFDCVLGLSGGRDSTYLVYIAKKLGLRPLLVHFNDGFSNPIAGQNIRNVIRNTNFELRTITSDWRESKDIKISLMKASVPDMQLGTDLGIASTLYSVAAKENIKYILSGVSFRTEGIVPLDWNYLDGRYLKSIMKKYGTIKIRKWKPHDPGFNFDIKEFLYYSIFKRIEFIPLIYHLDYKRPEVEEIIKKEFDWVYPGAHYLDDLFQSLMTYILRVKFNIEFRRFNYSALIRSGQLKKEDAIKKMKSIYASEDEKIIDLCIKRLGLTKTDIETIMKTKPKSFKDFKTNYNLIKLFRYPIKVLCKVKVLPPSLYLKFFT
jgi:hypothetical protein